MCSGGAPVLGVAFSHSGPLKTSRPQAKVQGHSLHTRPPCPTLSLWDVPGRA